MIMFGIFEMRMLLNLLYVVDCLGINKGEGDWKDEVGFDWYNYYWYVRKILWFIVLM